jgi:hypothetical protein
MGFNTFTAKSMRQLLLGLAALTLFSASGCYSFKGISIDYSQVKTYFVDQFDITALNAEPTIAIRLTEDLKEKIRTESRLTLEEIDPDISFEGTVTSINRLTIEVAVQYINNVNEEKSWERKRPFSFFFDFGTSQALADVEEEAISTISQQMMEDIFNAAFTDW